MPEHREALHSELKLWKGTRFMAGKGERGIAADCVHFVVSVLVNIGAWSRVYWPRYTCAGGGKEMGDLLHVQLLVAPQCKQIWIAGGAIMPELMEGDVCEFSAGERHHHVALFIGKNTVRHCVAKYGVCDANLNDPMLATKLRSVFRFSYEPAADLERN